METTNTPKPKKKRDRVATGVHLVYILLLLVTVLFVIRLVGIQLNYTPGPKLARVITQTSVEKVLEPKRGAILSDNGSPLAISVPVYTIHMDCTVRKETYARMTDKERGAELEAAWLEKARRLSEGLSKELGDRSAAQYYELIRSGRENRRQYELICKDVDHQTYKNLLKLPLFNEPSHRGGMISDSRIIRLHPYGELALRTLGYVRPGQSRSHVGLEGKFDYAIHGKEGSEWMREVDNKALVRDYTKPFIPATDGYDIRTTLNIDIQDIADAALREQILGDTMVEGGCAVVMDVKTGAIKAMVNLLRDPKTDRLGETLNMAIGRVGEPGSIFKTVTLMTVIEDGYIKSLDDKIPTNHGRIYTFEPDRHILDYEREHHTNQIPIIEGFKVSSNYMFQYLADKYYGKDPKRFLDKLYTYKLGEAFDFDLSGLATPHISSPNAPGWGQTSLCSVAFGYSTEETPLHMLTFYNGIANKGRLMKPYLVESIEDHGRIIEKKGPAVLNGKICSTATADTLVRALKSVTEEGTAKRLKGASCTVAGKTGTSRVLMPGIGYKDSEGRFKNQGTFVGFFPAEDPQYSIIAVVYSKPSHQSFYGGTYPAAAVRRIVDQMYNSGMIDKKI
ncbi:MAG: penicillin-binding protein 2 [Bacteroidales bacterium]|nr:penicillin-binding protein 2 [Bacteroidales bacterium]